MSILDKLAFKFPAQNREQQTTLKLLQSLLPNLDTKPEITLSETTGANPEFAFSDTQWTISKNDIEDDKAQVELAANCLAQTIPIARVFSLLETENYQLDHIGLNLPAASQSEGQWKSCINTLAKGSKLFQFPVPGDNKIYFVLPGLEPSVPAPLLEFTYDTILSTPTLHFTLNLKLSRADLLAQYPEAVAKPGDEEFFLSIAIESPWNGLVVYFDLAFQRENAATLNFLVKEYGEVVEAITQ